MENVNWKQVSWAAVVIVLVLSAAFLGVKYPLPPQPQELTPAVATPAEGARALGTYVESLIVDKKFTSNGTTTLNGAVTMASAAMSGIGDLTAATGLSGGWDLGVASAAAATAGQTVDITGQAGGTAATDGAGKAGGNVTITAGAGSAKNGSGTPDGNGGDLVLSGGARGGATGGATIGAVLIGSPTLATTKAANMLGVAGAFEVDGASQFDGAVSQTSTVAQTLINVAGAGANPWDYTGTLAAMVDGDDFTLLDVNITNGNHTGTTSTVQALDIAGITADAEATETAIKVGAGWDYGLDLDGNAVIIGADAGVTLDETSDDVLALTFGAGAGKLSIVTGNLAIGAGTPGVALNGQDAYVTGTFEVDGASQFDGAVSQTSTVSQTLINVAGASANPWDYTGTLAAMTDGDDFTLFDVNVTNGNHTGTTSTVQALDIAGITADAEATETAIKVGAGWDFGLDLDGNSVILGADAGVTLDETSDDVLALTFGAGTGKMSIVTGNLAVGAGSPGVALNGEDAYVTGTFEVDGASQFDGAVQFNGSVTGGAVTNDLNGGAFILDPTGSTILRAQVDDTVTMTSASATGTWGVKTGNLTVGAGTPGLALNGQDAYVSDHLEVDGVAQFDGAVTTNSTLAADGGLSVDTSNFTVSGSTGAVATLSSVSVGTWVKLGAATPISVTGGSTITPAGTYQPLTSAGPVTCNTTTCIANGTTAGDLLILRNANTTDGITIDGAGGNVECKSDVALAGGDTLTLIWNGSDWNCLATYDNS